MRDLVTGDSIRSVTCQFFGGLQWNNGSGGEWVQLHQI